MPGRGSAAIELPREIRMRSIARPGLIASPDELRLIDLIHRTPHGTLHIDPLVRKKNGEWIHEAMEQLIERGAAFHLTTRPEVKHLPELDRRRVLAGHRPNMLELVDRTQPRKPDKPSLLQLNPRHELVKRTLQH